mmetsp:Transcript_51168/g.153730  ORF Transcript_51168/g.153730 Transcript_51168/m.153730 type:complete len:381 (-) Transcript_51168:399-1541(-)
MRGSGGVQSVVRGGLWRRFRRRPSRGSRAVGRGMFPPSGDGDDSRGRGRGPLSRPGRAARLRRRRRGRAKSDGGRSHIGSADHRPVRIAPAVVEGRRFVRGGGDAAIRPIESGLPAPRIIRRVRRAFVGLGLPRQGAAGARRGCRRLVPVESRRTFLRIADQGPGGPSDVAVPPPPSPRRRQSRPIERRDRASAVVRRIRSEAVGVGILFFGCGAAQGRAGEAMGSQTGDGARVSLRRTGRVRPRGSIRLRPLRGGTEQRIESWVLRLNNEGQEPLGHEGKQWRPRRRGDGAGSHPRNVCHGLGRGRADPKARKACRRVAAGRHHTNARDDADAGPFPGLFGWDDRDGHRHVGAKRYRCRLRRREEELHFRLPRHAVGAL